MNIDIPTVLTLLYVILVITAGISAYHFVRQIDRLHERCDAAMRDIERIKKAVWPT